MPSQPQDPECDRARDALLATIAARDLWRSGAIPEALIECDRALLLVDRLEPERFIDVRYWCLSTRARVLHGLGRRQEGLDDLGRAVGYADRLIHRAGDPGPMLLSFRDGPLELRRFLALDLARHARERLAKDGRFREADAQCAKALDLVDATAASDTVAYCHGARAEVRRWAGLHGESAPDYRRAAEYYTDARDELLAAHYHHRRANALLNSGRRDSDSLREALEAYRDATDLYGLAGERTQAANCLREQAHVLAEQGHVSEALRVFGQARAVFEGLDLQEEAVHCLLMRAALVLIPTQAVDIDQAGDILRDIYHERRERLRQGDFHLFYYLYGLYFVRSRNRAMAVEFFTKARYAARAVRRGAARVYLADGGSDNSDYFDIIRKLNIPSWIASGLHQWSSVMMSMFLPHETAADQQGVFAVIQEHKGAILLDSIWSGDSPPHPLDHTVRGTPARARLRTWLLGEGADARYRAEDPAGDDGRRTRRRETFTHWAEYLESLRHAQGRPPAWQHVNGHPRLDWYDAGRDESLVGVRAALRPRWAILDLWYLNQAGLVVQISTRERTAMVRTGIGAGVDDFSPVTREFMHLQRGDEVALERFYPMHRKLIRALEPYLEGISHCYVVPHSWSWLFEFNILLNLEYVAGKDDSPRFGVAYLPAAALLPHLKPVALRGRALTLANPERGSQRTLPFAEWEADRVRRSLASTCHDVWAGPAATFDRASRWGESSLSGSPVES